MHMSMTWHVGFEHDVAVGLSWASLLSCLCCRICVRGRRCVSYVARLVCVFHDAAVLHSCCCCLARLDVFQVVGVCV